MGGNRGDLGQVGEDGHREVDRVGAPEREGMRENLHRAGRVSCVEHLAKGALQVDRLGRGALHLVLDAADHALDGSEQVGLAATGLEQRPHQESRGRLAFGSRDPDGLKLGGGIAVESGCGGRHHRANAVYPHLGDCYVELAFNHERYSASFDGVRREVVTVPGEPGYAKEERPGNDLAVVVGEVCDLDAGNRANAVGDRANTFRYLGEAH